MKQAKEQSVKILPLGGLDAIGKNMTVFEYGEDIIIVDCGIMFPTEETPGIDFIIPDFSYVAKNRHRIKGILITHGHEDHIGAVPFLLKEVSAPVFATRLTLGLIQNRLEERPPRQKPDLREVAPGDRFQVGAFAVEFIAVTLIIDGTSPLRPRSGHHPPGIQDRLLTADGRHRHPYVRGVRKRVLPSRRQHERPLGSYTRSSILTKSEIFSAVKGGIVATEHSPYSTGADAAKNKRVDKRHHSKNIEIARALVLSTATS